MNAGDFSLNLGLATIIAGELLLIGFVGYLIVELIGALRAR